MDQLIQEATHEIRNQRLSSVEGLSQGIRDILAQNDGLCLIPGQTSEGSCPRWRRLALTLLILLCLGMAASVWFYFFHEKPHASKSISHLTPSDVVSQREAEGSAADGSPRSWFSPNAGNVKRNPGGGLRGVTI